ncbi:CatB-related O-acetyltransferase [sulfur-oxidizing endosymbiont of Gigantopelta aegis]|uniref:CatB-related O-acetyltransferase n=1 Tax=sulfur-oxidizing endosymbiont of Gigantopelta aegis TaxID=2794934 RepID=UPI003CCE1649
MGNDVWICGNAIILSGVTIGDGAVIGNSAVVTRNVKPYSIVAGNPAKHIKYRFDSETISELLNIRWWNWPEEKIKKTFIFFLTIILKILFRKQNNKP